MRLFKLSICSAIDPKLKAAHNPRDSCFNVPVPTDLDLTITCAFSVEVGLRLEEMKLTGGS